MLSAGPHYRQAPRYTSGGTICGMNRKTTIYLSDELKEAIEREAQLRGSSEAEVIRQAITAAVVRPRPHPGLIEAKPFADRAEQLLSGFGER